MIGFLLIVAVVAVGGWFVCFVVFPPTYNTLPVPRRGDAPARPATVHADKIALHTAHTWTALDDRQLDRLLHGAHPRDQASPAAC